MDYISNGNGTVAIEKVQTGKDKVSVIAYGKCLASAMDDKQHTVSEGKKSIRDRLK